MFQVIIAIGNQKAFQLGVMLPREFLAKNSLLFRRRMRVAVGRDVRRTRRRRRAWGSISSHVRSGRRVPSFWWSWGWWRSSVLVWRRIGTTAPRFLRIQAGRFLRVKRVTLNHMGIRVRSVGSRRTSFVPRWRTIAMMKRRWASGWSRRIVRVGSRRRRRTVAVMRRRRTTLIVHSHVMWWHGSDRLGTRASRSSSARSRSTEIVGSTGALPRHLGDGRVGSDDRASTRALFRGGGGSTARQRRSRGSHGSWCSLGSRRTGWSFGLLATRLCFHVRADLG
mmetsp:Transcript_5850/g.11959  ORF Transcript_5850/g.11959 Transcript_5850/m.11959 type:complete len:280 (-) Transcript_5850:951-1790(-)